MLEKTNIKWHAMSDIAIIATLGNYIKQQRLKQNKTQAAIAEAAGINRWTLSQLEKGEAVSLSSFIQILRALDLLSVFNAFKQEPAVPSPIQLAKLEQQKRQRASSKKNLPKKDSEW